MTNGGIIHGAPAGLRGRLIRGGTGVTLISLAEVALGLAAAILLARLLGVEGLGYYSIVFAIAVIAGLFAELGIPTLVMREIASAVTRGAVGEIRGLLRFGICAMALASAAICLPGLAVLMLAGGAVPAEVFDGLAVGWVLIPLTALNNFCSGVLMGHHRVVHGRLPEGLVRPAVFLSLLLYAGFAGGAPLTPAAAIGFQVAATGASLVLSVTLVVLCPRGGSGTPAAYRVREWLAGGLVLGINHGLRIVQPQLLILLMPLVSTVEAAGLLRLAQRAAALADFGSGAVNLTIGPHIASLHAAGDRPRLQRLVTAAARIMSGLLVAGTVVFAIIGTWLIDWVVGAEFLPAYWPIMIMLGGLVATAVLGPNVMLLQMAGAARDVTVASAAAIVLGTSAAAVLAPALGASGAAWAALLAACLQSGFLWFRVRLRMGIDPAVLEMRAPGREDA